MDTTEHTKWRAKVKRNGIENELFALAVLEKLFPDEEHKVKLINKLLDLTVNREHFIEVKSCQAVVQDKHAKKGRRYGRFYLDRDQHEFLKMVDGYYLFIVDFPCGTKLIKFVQAKALRFKPQIVWWKLGEYLDMEKGEIVDAKENH